MLKDLISLNTLEIVKLFNEKFLDNKIKHPRPQRPGLGLAGFSKYLDKNRIQIMGKTELGYLASLKEKELKQRLKSYLSLKHCVIILSDSQEPSADFIKFAEKYKTPVAISKKTSNSLISEISSNLAAHFSTKTRINGVLMNVMGTGVMIIGKPGIGKSETALELIYKGHQLISDDLIEFYIDQFDSLTGRAVKGIKGLLEVRGLGIINLMDVFGAGALMEEKRLELVVSLEKWNEKTHFDRLGENKKYYNMLGHIIPLITIPVAPGRNLSTLIETAIKYFIARKYGKKTFIEKLYKEEPQ